MRTLQVITQTRGGPVDHAVDVAIELAKQGHDSHVLGPAGDYVAAFAGSGVTMHELEIASKGDLRGAAALARLVSRLKPSVLHCQDRLAGLFGRTVIRGGHVGVVYTLHGVPDALAGLVAGNLGPSEPGLNGRLAYLAGERWLSRSSRSLVVTPCQALAEYAVSHVGIRPGRVHVVHNGVGPGWLNIAPRSTGVEGPSAIDSVVRLVWLGVMQPVKRVPELIHAIAEVAQSANVTLTLIGDGPERPQIESAVAKHGVTDRVEFAGFRSDPATLLRTADILVLPSGAEACPMAVLQGMACSLPIVASRVGGLDELVRDGVDGILVTPGSHQDLVRALRDLVEHRSTRLSMGADARARLHARFTAEQMVGKLLDVYAEAAR